MSPMSLLTLYTQKQKQEQTPIILSTTNSCHVERLTCKSEEERMKLAIYTGLAAAWKNIAFLKIFPWENMCKKNKTIVHYIALKENKNKKRRNGNGNRSRSISEWPTICICGWMTTKYVPELNGIYLSEISTRNATDSAFRGTGRILHNALISYEYESKSNKKMDFIYLYPLNEEVEKVYITWGYTKHPILPYMFYGNPSNIALDILLKKYHENLSIENEEKYKNIAEIRSLLERIKDIDLLHKFDSKVKKGDPKFQELMMNIIDVENDEEKIGMIYGYLN